MSRPVAFRCLLAFRLPLVLILLSLSWGGAYVLLAKTEPSGGPAPAGAAGRAGMAGPARCDACHGDALPPVQAQDHPLFERAGLSRAAWADSIDLSVRCGGCHLPPQPEELPTMRWHDAVANYMSKVTFHLGAAPAFDPPPTGLSYPRWMHATRDQWLDVLHYYLVFSAPETPLPPDPAVSGRPFVPVTLGHVPAADAYERIGNVNLVDLNRDGRLDVLACDFNRQRVTWIYQETPGGPWQERAVAPAAFPGHTEVGDFDGDGHLDVVVAVLGSDVPTDRKAGGVLLLLGDGALQFRPRTLLRGVGRVADVRPGDFDGDGDVDFVVAVFGFLQEGEIGWLERHADGSYAYHRLSDKRGAVHVPPVDLNGDGRLDFIALIAQEHEEVVAFLNDGAGGFTQHLLYQAASPTFGSSGIELVDLDQDGDQDVLYTNGDAFDLSSPMIRPYHGVQWLENLGGLQFRYHDLLRFYGAYRAVPGDLDRDGDLDIVAVSLLNDWSDPARMSILWFENDGRQQFTPHGIGNAPTSLISAAVGDVDGDGWLDIVTGSMHMDQGDRRRGRVTLWRNAAE